MSTAPHSKPLPFRQQLCPAEAPVRQGISNTAIASKACHQDCKLKRITRGTGRWMLQRMLQAFSAAVPLEEWAADLPDELRRLCCFEGIGGPANEHLLQDLTPARTADLLAVALTVLVAAFKAAARDPNFQPFGTRLSTAANNLYDMFIQPMDTATVHLPAAAVEALLRLAVQLRCKTSDQATTATWPDVIEMLCELPAAPQLPTAAILELAQQAVQAPRANAALCASPLFGLLSGRELTAEQAKVLLSLLRGPSAAVAADVFMARMTPGRRSVMAWLASQPGAAAAAAGLGLTAADVADPDAAALLFGGQAAAGAAGDA
ncbi:hypothetical protein OEZ86_004172 [Tetradesmus obliquus]|nr:hypothetical protein OEZ86_004172 [Tetradesmus obliquus]